jgi:HAD superfamily hydrolase (TIGR01509 family)
MRSDNPGTDSSRWRAYARTLMAELRCSGEALERVREAMRARHEAGDLWTYVEDGTVETLEQIKDGGYRLGIVSNADGRVATFLARAGLADHFDVIVDSGIFGVEKPDPRIFLHACEQLRVDPKGTLYVGDVYEVDALGARHAGLTPVILAGAAGADWDCAVIQSLAEIPALLMNEMRPAAS